MYLEIDGLSKSYGQAENRVKVLNDVGTEIEEGKMCVILGPSGSGKSTLLNIIGGLDTADSGTVVIDGVDITKEKADKITRYRRNNLGFIFQFYNLISNLTIRENIRVCENLAKKPLDLDQLISAVGLKEHQNKLPAQLSGGQQQRCAIARALIKNPKLLLCDEPTGALDSKTSCEILELMETVNKKYGTTILIVTHNELIKNMVHKVILLRDGKIVQDYYNQTITPASQILW
ncbi:MAG: ABC transporter ATP-binding protein [Ethanoligenens sp.]